MAAFISGVPRRANMTSWNLCSESHSQTFCLPSCNGRLFSPLPIPVQWEWFSLFNKKLFAGWSENTAVMLVFPLLILLEKCIQKPADLGLFIVGVKDEGDSGWKQSIIWNKSKLCCYYYNNSLLLLPLSLCIECLQYTSYSTQPFKILFSVLEKPCNIGIQLFFL